MIKMYCDRCKKEIKETRGLEKAWASMVDTMHQCVATLTGTPRFTINVDDHPANICPDCQREFNEFMTGIHMEQLPNSEIQEDDDPEEVKFGGF